MILRDAMARATARLRAAGIDRAERDVRRLAAHALSIPPDRVTLHLNDEIDADQRARFNEAIAQREAFRPVAQIVGSRAFWGRMFEVTGDVLDPRPETELIVELALAGAEPASLLDLGTGSGILAITLKCHWPAAVAWAVDISAAALDVARRNADAHGADVVFEHGDWFSPVRGGRFDLVICNPPYISNAEMEALAPDVRDWEPHMALTPGGDGLEAYRVIADGLADHLTPAGRALFEIGHSQWDAVALIMTDAGFDRPVLHHDLSGHPRVVEVTQTRP